MESSVPSSCQRRRYAFTVLRGGKSFGKAAHWQPVLNIYISPLTTSRSLTVRLLPPFLAGGMSGPMIEYSSSVRSLGERSLVRSDRARVSVVHMRQLQRIGLPTSNHK